MSAFADRAYSRELADDARREEARRIAAPLLACALDGAIDALSMVPDWTAEGRACRSELEAMVLLLGRRSVELSAAEWDQATAVLLRAAALEESKNG